MSFPLPFISIIYRFLKAFLIVMLSSGHPGTHHLGLPYTSLINLHILNISGSIWKWKWWTLGFRQYLLETFSSCWVEGSFSDHCSCDLERFIRTPIIGRDFEKACCPTAWSLNREQWWQEFVLHICLFSVIIGPGALCSHWWWLIYCSGPWTVCFFQLVSIGFFPLGISNKISLCNTPPPWINFVSLVTMMCLNFLISAGIK